MVLGSMSAAGENAVPLDSEHGAGLVGEYFLKSGCSNPLYISGYLDRRKQRGFRKGLGELAGKLQVFSGGCSFEDGRRAAAEIVRRYPECDAVLCANDILAAGLIRGAAETGIKVPEQLMVAGFDNIRLAEFCSPALTTVSLNLTEAGAATARQLLRLESGQLPEEINVGSELIIRESA
jgi:LacI family transcriptional regulator